MDLINPDGVKAGLPQKRPKKTDAVSTYDVLVMTKKNAQSCDVASLASIFAEHIYAKIKNRKQDVGIRRSENSEKRID